MHQNIEMPEPRPERRASYVPPIDCPLTNETREKIFEIEERLLEGGERMERIETSLKQNNDATQEIREIANAAKGFIKVTNWIGNGLKWLIGVGVAIGALWTAWHSKP